MSVAQVDLHSAFAVIHCKNTDREYLLNGVSKEREKVHVDSSDKKNTE